MANAWKFLVGVVGILGAAYMFGFWEFHTASDAAGSIRALVVFDNLVWCQDSGWYDGACELVESAFQYADEFQIPRR